MDGVLGRESIVVLFQLSQVMAEKRKEPQSQVVGLVKGHISIAVERSYPWIIRGAWLPSPMREHDPGWDL